MRTWLKDIRTKKKISQGDMAEQLGVSRPYYSRIENGCRQQKMSIEMAYKLSKILGISIESILKLESD